MFQRLPEPEIDGLIVDIGAIAHTVSKALDYVGVDDRQHGQRVGLMCHRVAHFLGWDRPQRHQALIGGMLHDIGVSSTRDHKRLIDEIEWSHSQEHCERGDFFARCFAPFAPFANAIKYHHTRFSDMPNDLDDHTRKLANLIFMVDRLDVFLARFIQVRPLHSAHSHRRELIGEIEAYSGLLFDPELLPALCKAAEKPSFWLELRSESLDDAIFETLLDFDHTLHLSYEEMINLGEMLSLIIDTKSPFTHYHSLRVADLCHAVARLLGFSAQDQHLLRMAALLHDIGKLRTPDEVLEKDDVLTSDEQDVMAQHPLDSKLVLKALFPNAPIAKWASQHHEKLNGSGYPYGWSGDEIDYPTRVLSICDIFQALSQPRPYRKRMALDDVMAILKKMTEAGELDADIMAVIGANSAELYNIAVRAGEDYRLMERFDPAE